MTWFWALACVETAAVDSVPASGCEVGTGDSEFLPLLDGDEVPIIAGPQGGYHITTAARAFGVEGTPTVSATLRLEASGEFLGPGVSLVWPYDVEDGAFDATGLLNLLVDPEAARGQSVLLAVTVEDDRGVLGRDERTVQAR